MDELNEIARFEIQEGWDVLDADDQRIGAVVEVHDGGFTVETATGGRRDVPFTDIESADDGHVTIALSGEELASDPEL